MNPSLQPSTMASSRVAVARQSFVGCASRMIAVKAGMSYCRATATEPVGEIQVVRKPTPSEGGLKPPEPCCFAEVRPNPSESFVCR